MSNTKTSAMSEAGFEEAKSRFQSRYLILSTALRIGDESDYTLKKIIIGIANAAHSYGPYLLSHIKISRGEAKKISQALKPLLKIRRAPRSPEAWYQKNARNLEYLYSFIGRSYISSEDLESSDSKFKHEGFYVHNGLGLSEAQLKGPKDVITTSVKLLRKFPGGSRLNYGPLNLVGAINGPNVVAWYYPSHDTVSMRTRVKKGPDDVHSLIHELGHRFWGKFAKKEAKSRWTGTYTSVRRSPAPGTEPKIGEDVGVPIRGRKDNPIIVDIFARNRKWWIVLNNDPDSIYDLKKIQKQRVLYAKWPTRYAAQDHEEYFCECLALYCLGKLKGGHLDAFKSIWLGDSSGDMVSDTKAVRTKPDTSKTRLEYQDLLVRLVSDWVSLSHVARRLKAKVRRGDTVVHCELETESEILEFELNFVLSDTGESFKIVADPKVFDANTDRVQYTLKGVRDPATHPKLLPSVDKAISAYADELAELG